MDIVWTLIALAAAAALAAFAVLRKTAGKDSTPAMAGLAAQRPATVAPAGVPPTSVPAASQYDSAPSFAAPEIPAGLCRPIALPPALEAFQPQFAKDLPGSTKQVIIKTFKDVPRPPKLLHHLLSNDFVSTASSAELEDLIVGEPLIAAKVLATVNSPLYGLKTQVRSIGQAVSYLGLNAVRSVCLQYILIDSFKADSSERERALNATWTASALASEMIQRLAQHLSLPDQGALVSAVVLSFLGRLATSATLPHATLAEIPSRRLLARAAAEQQAIGLASGEVGRLLMTDWELPRKIIDDAADIDLVLTTPLNAATAADPVRRARLALCYLCARLGERLAEGEMENLRGYDILADRDPDFFHAWSYFDDARLYRLAAFFRSEELDRALGKMIEALREPEMAE